MPGTARRAWLVFLLVVPFAAHSDEAAVPDPKRIILETDMTFDVDDVGALAVLHTLADDGRVKILAVNYNEIHPDGARAIDAINTFYARGDLPVGVYRGELSDPDSSRYLDHLAAFPHRLTADSAPDALDVYRRVLNDQPDASVTIVSVGFLNNLADLLRAEADLVASKVEKLVVMGGRHNDGFNLVRHGLVETTQEVIENWPTPLAITDYGGRVRTGTDACGHADRQPRPRGLLPLVRRQVRRAIKLGPGCRALRRLRSGGLVRGCRKRHGKPAQRVFLAVEVRLANLRWSKALPG